MTKGKGAALAVSLEVDAWTLFAGAEVAAELGLDVMIGVSDALLEATVPRVVLDPVDPLAHFATLGSSDGAAIYGRL